MLLKLLKWLLIAFAALIAVIYIGGLLMSPKFTVTRSIEVAAPADKVYALVAAPREWKRWSVWNQRDPAMQITYGGPESGQGASWQWKSKSEGDGRMTMIAVEPGRRVGYELYFPDFGTTSSGDIRFEPAGAGTRVSWTMNGDMGANPVWRWMTLFADDMVGKDFEAGLANLKALAEKG